MVKMIRLNNFYLLLKHYRNIIIKQYVLFVKYKKKISTFRSFLYFLPNIEINEFQGRGANIQFVAAILKLLLDLPFMGIWTSRAFVLAEFYGVRKRHKKNIFHFQDDSNNTWDCHKDTYQIS